MEHEEEGRARDARSTIPVNDNKHERQATAFIRLAASISLAPRAPASLRLAREEALEECQRRLRLKHRHHCDTTSHAQDMSASIPRAHSSARVCAGAGTRGRSLWPARRMVTKVSVWALPVTLYVVT